MGSYQIETAAPEDLERIRGLFLEYQTDVGVDLCFQGFEAEVAGLPGDYAPPRGRLWIARVSRDAAGCIALRPLAPDAAEMKRLFVRPAYRGLGLGRALARTCIDAARDLGYERLRLDTLPSMRDAIAMYRTLGFVEIAPYRANPVAGALFFELVLRPPIPA